MGFNEPEQAVMERTTMGFHLALASDQVSTLFPEKPTAFKSYEDVVEKLVPYHIWQVCDEELDGQGNETEVERRQREEEEEKAAQAIVSRMRNIQNHLMRGRLRDGSKPSPTVDLISLIRESTSVLRDEVSNIQRDYRRLNAERDTIEIAAKKREEQAAYQRGIEAISRNNAERARVHQAKEAAAAKEAQAKQAAAKASPAVTTKIPAKATPKSQSPSTTASPHHSTPTPTRGRGRPRGGGGLREQAMTHVAQSKTATPSTSRQSPISATASPSPGPASPAAAPASAAQTYSAPSPSGSPAPSPAASGSSKPKSIQGEDPANVLGGEMLKGPVNISFPITSIPDLLKAGILSREANPAVKPPAHIGVQHDDPNYALVSLDLRKFSPVQLVALSKILKIPDPRKANASTNGSSAGTSDAPSASGSASGAS